MGSKLYLFLSALIVSNIGCIYWLQGLMTLQQTNQSPAQPFRFARDARHIWSIDRLPAIAIPIEDTLRYQLNSTGNLEWTALIPNDGIIYLGSQRTPYTVSMFHQLRCLDLLRRHVMRLDWPQRDKNLMPAPEGKHDLTHHCLEYLRQMVVCRADTALEGLSGRYAATREGIARCEDWRAVYDALRRNNMG